MASIFELISRWFGGENKTAAEARDRIKEVLKKDRVKITPEAMAEMKDDIIRIMSEYMEIDLEDFELRVEQEKHTSQLVASIPIKGGRAEVSGKRKPVVESPVVVTKKTTSKRKKRNKKNSTKAKLAKSAVAKKTDAKGVKAKALMSSIA